MCETPVELDYPLGHFSDIDVSDSENGEISPSSFDILSLSGDENLTKKEDVTETVLPDSKPSEPKKVLPETGKSGKLNTCSRNVPKGTRGGARNRYNLRPRAPPSVLNKTTMRAASLLSENFYEGEGKTRTLICDKQAFKKFKAPFCDGAFCGNHPEGTFTFERKHRKWSALKGGPVSRGVTYSYTPSQDSKASLTQEVTELGAVSSSNSSDSDSDTLTNSTKEKVE